MESKINYSKISSREGKTAIAQITVLILGIIALSWAIGSEVKYVSAEELIFNENQVILSPSSGATDFNIENSLNSLKTGDSIYILKKGPYSNAWIYNKETQNFEAYSYKRIGQNYELTTDLQASANEDNLRKFMQNSLAGKESYNIIGKTAPEKIAAASPLPVQASHGLAGKIYEWFGGEGSTAPAGEYKVITDQGAVGVQHYSGAGFSISGIMQGALHALVIYGFLKMAGGMFLDKDKANALAKAGAWGYFVGKGVYSLIGEGGWLNEGATSFLKLHETGWWSAKAVSVYSGVIVGAIIFLSMYKKEKTKTITFTCDVWEPQKGGANCEKCNQQGVLPCSEYQCRSLGAGCQLVNKGTNEEKCIWVNRRDTEPPIIQPWIDALTDGYVYSPDKTISPPDRGVKIVPKNGGNCIKAFTPIQFGITTSEPSQCRIDYERKSDFKEMRYYFGGSSLYRYNHSQIMSLPGKSNLESENLTIQNNGNYNLYVRCSDANGNKNIANFVFKYCVEPGPDTTPPIIVTTDLLNNMPVAFNQSEVDIRVYTNEPAECKWSHLDMPYDEMENQMQCSSSVLEMNAQMLYECETTLNGIKSRQTNKFYFRCRDQPFKPLSERNTNQESYVFTILGTQPLVITSVSPNNTVIKDSTEAVKVVLEAETSAGYNEGNSTCYYGDENEDSNYIKFYKTDSYHHEQELWLAAGHYDYWIKCVDLGGNSDVKHISFEVETDNQAPLIARVFKEDEYLKIITTEKAKCVYDTQNCNYIFDEGNQFIESGDNETEHYTEWNTEINYYVKCRDDYGNEPSPNQCSIIIRPTKL